MWDTDAARPPSTRNGASYAVGLDGLSLLLVLLTTFLTFIAVLASWAASATADSRGKEYYIAFLLLEAGMLGVYMALDLLLFCLCWVLAAAVHEHPVS